MARGSTQYQRHSTSVVGGASASFWRVAAWFGADGIGAVWIGKAQFAVSVGFVRLTGDASASIRLCEVGYGQVGPGKARQGVILILGVTKWTYLK